MRAGRLLLIRATTILRRSRYRIPNVNNVMVNGLLKYSVLKICDQVVKKRWIGSLFDFTFSEFQSLPI